MNQMSIDPRLRILEPLGVGGTAIVLKAYHAELKRVVAVKQWRSDCDTSPADFLQLANREYDLIGGYRFPGLVRIVKSPQSRYHQILLEYCPGPTLDSVKRPENTTIALNIISALALNLEFLRIAGLVHGDLKPQNVFLPVNWHEFHKGHLSFVKLSDFSLGYRAKAGSDHRLGLGTIGYMAPETIVDGVATHRSDLFALGIIAYQLLTGVHPFLNEDSDPVKVSSRIREQEPMSLAVLRPDLTPELVTIVTQLLNKSEASRPKSGWATCVELEQAGATYPFRRAWRPTSLFRTNQSYDKYLNDNLTLQDKESARLRELTGGDPATLRLLLTANFLRNRLSYDGDHFKFTDTIYWPHRLRAELLTRFSTGSFEMRRATVITASVGGHEAATLLGIADKYNTSSTSDALAILLLPLLKIGTIKRTSARYAPVADRLNRHKLAMHLHLQAGDMCEAERCADLAARKHNRNNENNAALALLHTLDLRARTAGKEFECRRTLLLKGNIHKEIGELDQAEAIYNRIVNLYQNHPSDKLLAETHKNIGEMFRLRQDSQSALAALQKSLNVFRDLNDELEISHTLVNIGNVHWVENDTKQALINYRAAYKIQEQLDAKADLASTLHNIASIYCLDGRTKRGIFLLKHTLGLKKEIGHQGEIARTLNNLGYAYQITGYPAQAADYITESLEINRRIGSNKEVLYNLENLVTLHTSAGQLKDSLKFLKEGQRLATKHSLTAHEAQFYLHTATIAKRMGRYNDAVQGLNRVDALLPELDDPTLNLATIIQKASLRYHLGDNPTALKLALDVYSRAKVTNNSVPELDALLLLVRLSEDPQYREQGKVIVDERRLVRDKRLLAFGRLEYLLNHHENDAARELADGLIDQLSEVEQDLELAWMESLAGRICLEQKQFEDANRHLQRALKAAQDSGVLPELITVQILRGQLAKTQGDFETAYTCLKQALGVGRTVANSIDDAGDRLIYQKKPVMQTLASEIATLSRQLGNRQRAGR
ncbi:MAG: tetratricopeptide repeat protein [candidate division Zixibacteria bacterium]|nr:tetratricopeptide repeat protein [candidate division Zixibacteria bacterium]